MPRLNSVQVRATFDQTLGDAYNIEGFTPNTGTPLKRKISKAGHVYIWVDGEPDYNPGQARVDALAGFSRAGKQQVRLTTPQMHVDSYAWLRSNYEGQVTANLRTSGTTYARYNCVLSFEDRPSASKNFREVTWIFTIIEAL